MDEPKLTRAPVDVERLVRNLLDAFDSLKTNREPRTLSTAKQPVSSECEERPAPDRSLNDSTNSNARRFQLDDRSTAVAAVEPSEREAVRCLDAVSQEPQTPSPGPSLAALPRKPCAPSIPQPPRRLTNPMQSREAFSPERIQRRYHKLEPSIPYLTEMSETIRRAALARLEMEPLEVSERRETAWRRIYSLLIWRTHTSPRLGARSRRR